MATSVKRIKTEIDALLPFQEPRKGEPTERSPKLLNEMPLCLIRNIFSYMDPADLVSVERVSKLFEGHFKAWATAARELSLVGYDLKFQAALFSTRGLPKAPLFPNLKTLDVFNFVAPDTKVYDCAKMKMKIIEHCPSITELFIQTPINLPSRTTNIDKDFPAWLLEARGNLLEKLLVNDNHKTYLALTKKLAPSLKELCLRVEPIANQLADSMIQDAFGWSSSLNSYLVDPRVTEFQVYGLRPLGIRVLAGCCTAKGNNITKLRIGFGKGSPWLTDGCLEELAKCTQLTTLRFDFHEAQPIFLGDKETTEATTAKVIKLLQSLPKLVNFTLIGYPFTKKDAPGINIKTLRDELSVKAPNLKLDLHEMTLKKLLNDAIDKMLV